MMLKLFRSGIIMKNKFFFLFAGVCLLALTSCNRCPYPGYEKSSNGLWYQIVEDKDGKVPSEGDFIKVNARYVTMNDSVFFDTGKELAPMWIPVSSPAFHGDIMEGLLMLSTGDSASFIVRADTFFLLTVGATELPSFLKEDSMMYVHLRVTDIKSQNDFAMEKELIENELDLQYAELKAQETALLKEYLNKNKISEKPRESGLIFQMIRHGNGKQLQIGQKVKVHYTGMLIDGQVFDSSIGRDPLEVIVGSPDLIDGFNETLLLMSVGSEARAIMPSSIAYGKSEIDSPIPPFSTVIFEMTVLSAD